MERTRGAIVNAFIQLLSEKPVNKITVKDIVERCGVNRNTFYYHFHDIPDLAEQMMEEKADQLIQTTISPISPLNASVRWFGMDCGTGPRCCISISTFPAIPFWPI